MSILEIILSTTLLVTIAGAIVYFVRRWNREAFQQGAFEMQLKMASTLSEPPIQSETQRSATFQSDMGSIIDKYDIVFDTELVSYFATGAAAVAWPVILEDIQRAILEKELQIPQGTNTIIVRSFKMKRDGSGEYKLEPVVNVRAASV